jgi:hypothetical protein
MQTMEAPSTEKRLDDLNARMAEGFGRVHREIDGLNDRMVEAFKRVDGDIRELRGDIKDLRSETSERFDAMHRTMMRGFFGLGGITVTLFVALAGLQGF